MKSENLKLLLDSYIWCKRSQDECDCSGNLAAENEVNTGRIVLESAITSSHIHLSDQEPNLPNDLIQIGRNLARIAQEFSIVHQERSIIKFKTICMVVEPVDQIVTIIVIRDPNFSQTVTKVSWKTCDKTALSGTHYVGTCGELIFDQNETNKEINIQISNSTDEAEDLRFTVELNYEGMFNPEPMTVSLKKINNFYPDEMSVLHNLPSSLPFTISDIKSVLDDCLTPRTFHTALTHLCSANTSTDVQIALALDLSYLCLNKLRGDIILNTLADFFRMDNFEF